MATYSYLRVSMEKQDLEKNKAAILTLANERHLGHVEWIEEKITSRVPWRKRKIGALMERVQTGDTIIVSEMSRLGRSLLEIMEILALATDKGIHIYAIKGNWQLDGSFQSKAMGVFYALAAEIERDLISQRTTEALAARKAQGFALGRPRGKGKSKLDPHKEEILALLDHGSTKVWVAAHYDTTVRNLDHWLKQHKKG